VQIVTYEDVSVCNLSPNFSCFISTTTFPHKCVGYETRSCACSHTTRRVSARVSLTLTLTLTLALALTFTLALTLTLGLTLTLTLSLTLALTLTLT